MPEPVRTSIILATYNRREVVLNTLDHLQRVAQPPEQHEIIVVDNRSHDGTPQAIQRQFEQVKVIRAPGNLGSCGKALGVEEAAGQFTLFLDDDSYPRPGSLDRMSAHLEADRFLGAVGFQVHLPNGMRECSALPNVFVGCGVGFQTQMLRDIGSLDPTLFMQAEEYDLAARMIAAGWRIECFPDCHVEHLKTPAARRSSRTTYYDTRNNLIVLARYLPEPYFTLYRRDWMQRYRWLARKSRRLTAHLRGWLAGLACAVADRNLYRPLRLTADAVEMMFRFDEIREHMGAVCGRGIRRIVLADLGKNIYPFYRAARQWGMTVPAIADDRFAAPGRCYRKVPILPVREALALQPEAVVVSNTAPVHAGLTARRLAQMTDAPVYDWFGDGDAPSEPV